MQTKIQLLRRRVVYSTAVNIRAQHFSETVGRAETFESWPSEKGVNSKWKTKKKTCPLLMWSRLSQRHMARFASCTEDFGTRLLRHKSSTKHIEICTTAAQQSLYQYQQVS